MIDYEANPDMHRVMIVDDMPDQIQTLLQYVKDDYIISAATNADSAIQKLCSLAESDGSQLPDVILMDVNMPGTNGYEACSMIRKESALEQVDVIFLSSNESTEEILMGLDAGSCDYIVKPYNPDVLMSRIKRTIQIHDQRESFRKNASTAREMAQTAMTVTGSLSVLLHFLRSGLAASSVRELCEACRQSLIEFGCVCVVYCRLDDERECLSSNDLPSMLELELLERVHGGKEPFIEKGASLFVLGRHVTLLIKSPPSDSDQLGSLKDNLKIMLEGADAKIDALKSAGSTSDKEYIEMGAELTATANALNDIRSRQEQHRESSIDLVERLSVDIEGSFYELGLTENQEEQLSKIISVSTQRCVDHLSTAEGLDEKVVQLSSELKRLAQRLGRSQ